MIEGPNDENFLSTNHNSKKKWYQVPKVFIKYVHLYEKFTSIGNCIASVLCFSCG